VARAGASFAGANADSLEQEAVPAIASQSSTFVVLMEHKVTAFIVDWLRAYAERAGTRGWVVGISGGVDSALTSALCARTGLPTVCVELPIHQPEDHVTRAWEHIGALRQEFPQTHALRVDLTPVYEATAAALFNEEPTFLALANTRSRLRMTALYAVAQTRGALVAGTGNKVEDFGIGFFTKYGDGGVDLSPIAGLTKTQVYKLAAHLGVPQSILQAAPTDGLWPDDRSDEDQIGATYPELEWALAQQESGATNEQPHWTERQRTVWGIYQRYHRANKHKMEPIPVCVLPEDLTQF
jgi:NAD+ synthase